MSIPFYILNGNSNKLNGNSNKANGNINKLNGNSKLNTNNRYKFDKFFSTTHTQRKQWQKTRESIIGVLPHN